eukprot:CAMPEP_0174859700 /NCGR_PEP_ID=MMETSP1114-20130205/47155_1 /TAXON_ID=312471 /ORGANISM="Neobodo designis, Strain CCAP 1951/1" /LENGTH=31 /DNA_ID= /DNA_START= /DNA_END= /DNA_ORIENTATION=
MSPAIFLNTWLTLVDVFADVSTNGMPSESAN